METLVSLMIMGLLITSLLSIIRFSMVLTGDSLSNANASQEKFNALLHGTNYSPGTHNNLEIVIEMPGTLPDVNAKVDVRLSADTDIPAAFIPVIPSPP